MQSHRLGETPCKDPASKWLDLQDNTGRLQKSPLKIPLMRSMTILSNVQSRCGPVAVPHLSVENIRKEWNLVLPRKGPSEMQESRNMLCMHYCHESLKKIHPVHFSL